MFFGHIRFITRKKVGKSYSKFPFWFSILEKYGVYFTHFSGVLIIAINNNVIYRVVAMLFIRTSKNVYLFPFHSSSTGLNCLAMNHLSQGLKANAFKEVTLTCSCVTRVSSPWKKRIWFHVASHLSATFWKLENQIIVSDMIENLDKSLNILWSKCYLAYHLTMMSYTLWINA